MTSFLGVLLFSAAGTAAADELRTLSLGQALDELDVRNLPLIEAKSRIEQARALVGQASSGLLPTLVAAGGYARNSDEARADLGTAIGGLFQQLQKPVPPGLPGPLYIQPLAAWTVSGSINVPLLAPTAWADRAAAQRGTEAAAQSASAIRLQLRGTLVQAAWAANAAEEIVTASERALNTAKEHRETAARMVAAGQAAPLSRLNADTEVVRRESYLVRARAELERARLALGVLLGKAEPLRVLPAGNADASVPVSSDILVGEALAHRPEIETDVAKIRAAEAQALSARLRLVPQISGSATAFASDMPYPTGKNDRWRVTLDASWAIFDGGYRSGRRAQADAEASAARAATDDARLAIAQEVADVVRDVGVAAERLRLAERQVAFASEAAASAKRTFEGGVAGSLDVLDANDRLFQFDVALADARGRLGMARAGRSV
jgi:outer membrane protein TolC